MIETERERERERNTEKRMRQLQGALMSKQAHKCVTRSQRVERGERESERGAGLAVDTDCVTGTSTSPGNPLGTTSTEPRSASQAMAAAGVGTERGN